MKLAIDLQACQTPGSAQRGIGRYSMELAKAIARNRGPHKIHFLLNQAFEAGLEPLEHELRKSGDVTCERYRLLALDGTHGEHRRKLQRINDEILNWRYACTGADALHIASVFEGWEAGGAHVSSAIAEVPIAVRSATLYDLIPLLFADTYLPPIARPMYLERLAIYKRLDLVFAISESARRDAIRHIDIAPGRIVSIGAAASPAFRRLESIVPEHVRETLSRLGIESRFMLYTGGIDFRKNIDGLLVAYAALPTEVMREVQLVVVCEITEDQRLGLLECARLLGIANAPVFTGYVSDEELNLLYNICELFVFPSLYEGFGLPLLEAMTCGACVMTSNTSSMPEIVATPEALFDPLDADEMGSLMYALLTDPYRRRRLGEMNQRRSREFSWDDVASRVIEALEESFSRRQFVDRGIGRSRRPKAALVTPQPPKQSMVTEYAAWMLPYWSRQFDLDVVTDERAPGPGRTPGKYRVIDPEGLGERFHRYDYFLYQIGIAELTPAIYRLLRRHPGIVAIHDSVLSGPAAGFPCDGPPLHKVIQHARGVIFHSQFAADHVLEAYPCLAGVPTCVVPLAATSGLVDVRRASMKGGPSGIATSSHPAHVAEQDARAVIYLSALDRARSAAGLKRRVHAIIVRDRLESNVAAGVDEAIAEGLKLYPACGRWLLRPSVDAMPSSETENLYSGAQSAPATQ